MAVMGGACTNEIQRRVVNLKLIGLKLARLAKPWRTEIPHDLTKAPSDVDQVAVSLVRTITVSTFHNVFWPFY